MPSPFARLNLYRNPFGELTREERGEVAIVETERWVELLRRSTAVIQFIGSCGEGKTTHLLAIARALPEASYVYLPPEGPHPKISSQRPLLIDEAERLGIWQRRRVFSRTGGLAIGTHTDLTRLLRRYGREVVTVDVAVDRSPERLMQILNRRLEASRLTPEAIPRIDLSQAVQLRAAFGGDIRNIERHLYVHFQQLATHGESWLPAR
ncbi:MAG: hypothetical protein ACYC6N_26205 [Pirellulaceae bacterium]